MGEPATLILVCKGGGGGGGAPPGAAGTCPLELFCAADMGLLGDALAAEGDGGLFNARTVDADECAMPPSDRPLLPAAGDTRPSPSDD